jgi:ribonuclease HI
MHPNRHAAAGFVVRDASGHPVLAMAKKLGMMEILVAEAMALREGLLVIPNLLNMHLIVEGDSKILIDAINGKIITPWKIKFLVLDILF